MDSHKKLENSKEPFDETINNNDFKNIKIIDQNLQTKELTDGNYLSKMSESIYYNNLYLYRHNKFLS